MINIIINNFNELILSWNNYNFKRESNNNIFIFYLVFVILTLGKEMYIDDKTR